MKRLFFWFLLAVATLLLRPYALGQGVAYSSSASPITDSMGHPIANVAITVCTAAATAPPTCGAAITVYRDAALTLPYGISNPLVSDGFGNFYFFLAPSSNTYCYTTVSTSIVGSVCQPFSVPIAPTSAPSFASITTTAGPNTLANSTTLDVANGVCGVGTGAASPKYANIAAALADSNCTTIEIAAKSGCYTETWSGNLTAHGTLIIHFKGCAVINTGGNNSLNLTVGGSTADNFAIYSDFPVSAHSNGSNSGVTFTGYTGTTCIICIGNGTNSSTSTLNVYIRGINFDLTAAGSGAVGWKLLNTQQFTVADIWCSMTAASTGCGLLDGTGSFTGAGTIFNVNFTGNTGANQFGIRGQNLVTDVTIQGGNGNLNGATGICYDVETNAEFQFLWPDCNAAAQAIKEVGASSRMTGWIRIDSGVVAFGTVSSGTFQVFCAGCSISSPAFTDSTGNASLFTTDGLMLNSQKWRMVATGTSFNIKDIAAGTTPISCITGGNCFLGEAANQPILDNNGGLILQGVTSGTVKDVVPSVVGGSFTITKPGANGTYLVTGNGASPIQTKRVSGCATGGAQFNTCDTTVTWTTAFADANYTATCTGDVVTSGVPIIEGHSISAAKTGNAITVRTIALTAAAAQFTTIDCTAVHD